jgi:FtsP/CotA-like multicopper oxidase with cupredoxin domain
MHFKEPDITVQQGAVEDWTIENRANEAHVFHIHQLHFQVIARDGRKVDDSILRDTIDLPAWDGKSAAYPSVTLRMDFRNPAIVGTFLYHCHILEHEDAGMMGSIQVVTRTHK